MYMYLPSHRMLTEKAYKTVFTLYSWNSSLLYYLESHHRWLRRILHVSCLVRQNFKETCKGGGGTGNIIMRRRLRWLGHVWRMDKDRRARYSISFLWEEREEEDSG